MMMYDSFVGPKMAIKVERICLAQSEQIISQLHLCMHSLY